MPDTPSAPPFPVVAAPQWHNIPELLAVRQQWLLWKYERPRDAKPDAKPLKMPYYVGGGRRTSDQGSERDRQRLATLAVAQAAFEKGGWTGVGFGFLKDGGLIGVDIDGAIDPDSGEVAPRCAAIISACASYTEFSPSGKGVHIITLGDTYNAKDNGIGLEIFSTSQYFTFTGRCWDATPAPLVPMDEAVLRRLHKTVADAKEASKLEKAAARAAALPLAGGAPGAARSDESPQALRARVESALEAISPDLAYTDWISVGWALRDAFGDFGFGLWNSWSARGSKYCGEASAQSHWRSFRASGKSADDAVGVVFARARDAGWKPPRMLRAVASTKSAPKAPQKNVSASAGDGPDAQEGGGPPEGPPPGAGGGGDGDGDGGDGGGDGGDTGSDIAAQLIHERKRPKDCRENVLYAMTNDPALQGLVRKNDFTQVLERSRVAPWGREPGEWDDEDDLMLGEHTQRNYRLGLKAKTTLRDGVLMTARLNKYNPIIDRIKAEKWDGTDRLDHWLADVFEVADRPFTRLIGKCFFMGLVNRAIRPGCKFDYMLILKGEQGLQKSAVFRALADPYFTDNAIRVGDKDSQLARQLAWIVESAELESLNKSENTMVKQHLSAQEDWFRPPYGAQMIRAPRHSVDVGTTNADTFLRDATGDRRFWPLEVLVVRLDVLENMRAQLFAEALHRLQAGERYWPTKEEEKALIFPEQEQFKRADPWEDYLDEYVNGDIQSKVTDAVRNRARVFFPTTELYDKALSLKADRIDGAGQADTRLGNCMKALGFKRHRETEGKRQRGFLRAAVAQVAGQAQNAPPGPSGGNHWQESNDDLPI